jgi:hypothetical protein
MSQQFENNPILPENSRFTYMQKNILSFQAENSCRLAKKSPRFVQENPSSSSNQAN